MNTVICKEVIITTLTKRGSGAIADPIRVITEIYEKDGTKIAENDPLRIAEFSAEVRLINLREGVSSIIEKHTQKLNIMKENRAKSDEEDWTDAACQECDRMIGVLASILSDLNHDL